MDNVEQNTAFAHAKNNLVAANEDMATTMREVMRVGMDVRYYKGKGKLRALKTGYVLHIQYDTLILLIRPYGGRGNDEVEVLDIEEIVEPDTSGADDAEETAEPF